MKVLIIDQCSGSKDYRESSPVLGADEIDSISRTTEVSKDGVVAKKARNLYSGRQQKLINEATNLLSEADVDVDRYFISAGFGLIEESTLLPPYEVTFSSMSDGEIRERSESLDIQNDLIDVITSDEYDIIFLPLGRDYYTALDLPRLYESVNLDTHFVVFNREADGENHDNVISLSARTDRAKEFGVIVVELKGKLIKNFAEQVVDGKYTGGRESLRDCCMYNPQDSLGDY